MRAWQLLKLGGRLLLRLSRDIATRDLFRFSGRARQPLQFPYFISLTQEIKPSLTFASKVFNLRLAGHRISAHVIRPNEIFSFWHAVGSPGRRFQKSRTIRNGSLVEEAGGGLCQAAGILYLAALQADLEVLERYNHSLDLYTEETRFAPLGSDATVVYGYKDLRLRNTCGFTIKFNLHVKGNTLVLEVRSTHPLPKRTLAFSVCHLNDIKIGEVLSATGEVLSSSTYKTFSGG